LIVQILNHYSILNGEYVAGYDADDVDSILRKLRSF